MELLRALGSLIEDPSSRHPRIARELGLPAAPRSSVHAAVVAFQRYPYASVHLGPEGMMGGEARDRIAGFRRALGMDGESGDEEDPAAADPAAALEGAAAGERAAEGESDHLAALLALAAALERWQRDEADAARAALIAQARTTLAWEHVLSWTGPYLASFEGCGSPFHEAWAALTEDALEWLAADMDFPRTLPAALREAPPMADPRRDGGPAFVASLLAPVRSGMVVLRDDLVRLGAEAGLACRAGERRYVLGAFLAQDPRATLGWLAAHAREWSGRAAGRGPAAIARWWSGRAETSAALMADLARGAAADPRLESGASRPKDRLTE